MIKPIGAACLLLSLLAMACNDKKTQPVVKPAPTPFIIKKDSTAAVKQGATQRPPIVNIIDTVAPKYIVLYVKDSAASSGRISQKLAKIYGVTLPQFIKANKLQTAGAPIAWYKSTKAPFFFEAGIPVNKKPAKLAKGILVRNVGGDSAVIAHFFGPYSITNMGYEALTDYMADNKKKRKGMPYEIYVTEPIGKDGKAIDPYKVQTDIVIPYK